MAIFLNFCWKGKKSPNRKLLQL